MGSYKKKLFIVLLLILLLNFFVCSFSFAVSTPYNYTLDTQYALEVYQERMAYLFLTRVSQNNSYEQFIEDVRGKFVIFSMGESNGGQRMYMTIYPSLPLINNLDEVNANTTEFYDYFLNVPTSGYNLTRSNWVDSPVIRRYAINFNNNTVFYNDLSLDANIFIPTLLIGYQNKMVNNFVNGIKPSESGLFVILNAINANTEQQEETTDEMKKLNDFMSSEDVDQDAYNMPTNNPTQDPTTDGINNIFNKFYSRITNWDSSNISVYIPFANKSFTIPANASEQLLNNFSNMGLGSTLKSLISAVWFYVLARYIIKDVQKYADGLKTGEILTKSDTNIKTEML